MWIPRPLYEAIPYAWAAGGTGLLAAAIVVERAPRGWLLAVGVLALTVGLGLWMRRRDYRASQTEYDPRSIDD